MKKRALIVDDTELNRKLAIAILRREGWEAEQVASGKAALALLKEDCSFDIVLLDIRMPDMSGEEVCGTLRADPRTAKIPLIAYTAHALEDELQGFRDIGFNEVLVKPTNVEAMRAALAKVLVLPKLPEEQG